MLFVCCSCVTTTAEESDEDEDGAALYDEVDEDEYMRIRQQRMGEDDFIVDDEGDDLGYRYVWDVRGIM